MESKAIKEHMMIQPYTRMLRFTRLVFWFIGLNALAGAVSLLCFPSSTGSLFFWSITPPLNAALFGALYLSGGVAVCWCVVRRDWERARALVPVLVVAGLLISGVTLLHLDRFNPGLRLGYWLFVYIGAPLLAAAMFIKQDYYGASWAVTRPLTTATRRLAVSTGALLLTAGVFLLLWPAPAVAYWPWPTSALMTRIFAAWFSAFGVGLLWFLVERDWRRLALLATLLIAAAGLDLAVLVAHWENLASAGPRVWLYVAHLLGLALVGGLMHWLQWRSLRTSLRKGTASAAHQAPA
jgi:hypothetical protein